MGSVAAEGIYDTRAVTPLSRPAAPMPSSRPAGMPWNGRDRIPACRLVTKPCALQTLRTETGRNGPAIIDEVVCGGQNEMPQAPGRAHYGQRLRPAECRGPDPHRTYEPLHITRHARDRPHALKNIRARDTSSQKTNSATKPISPSNSTVSVPSSSHRVKSPIPSFGYRQSSVQNPVCAAHAYEMAHRSEYRLSMRP